MNKYKNLLNEKYPKVIQKAKKKVPYPWNQDQLDTLFNIMSNAPRIRHGEEIIRYSLFKTYNLINNSSYLKCFFNYYYYYNIPELIRVCGGTYLNFNTQKNDIIDNYNKNANFKGFNFSKKDLSDSLIKYKNFTPLYAYIKKTEGKYRIVGGRHRIQVLKGINDFMPLCIFWDNMPQKIDCKLYIPNIFLTESLYLLKDIKILEQNNDFSLCYITDPTTLWLVTRTFDKEVSYLIDFYFDILQQLNISSPENILWKSL